MKKIIWIVILIIALFLLVSVYSSSQNSTPTTVYSSAFTVYPIQCNDWFTTPPEIADFSNCHKPKAMERHTFTVDVSKNQVIETSPDSSSVYKLDSCTILDAEHWSCGRSNSILAASKTSRSGDNFSEDGLTALIFVSESQWDSINNGAPSAICGTKWCD